EYRLALKANPQFEKARENLALAEPRAVLTRKLLAILDGKERPSDAAERVGLAEIAHSRGRFATAARFWDEAFTAKPALVEKYRYPAAGSAARAVGKRRPDAEEISNQDRTRWRA